MASVVKSELSLPMPKSFTLSALLLELC